MALTKQQFEEKTAELKEFIAGHKVYDELPQEVTHTSFLLKGDTEDLSEVANGTQMNRIAYEISEFNKVLAENDSEKAYEEILNKYAPYAKSI